MVVIFCLFIISIGLLLRLYHKQCYVFNKNLKCFPCPPELPVLGHALDFFSGRGYLEVLMEYTNKYGDVVRVKTGPNRQLLLISNYEFFELLLTTTKQLKKSTDYKSFYRWLGTGLITAEGAKWKKHRRLIGSTFSSNVLENFVDIFETNGKILAKQFEKKSDKISVDIYKLVNLCTLDIICESTMGTSIKAQEHTESEYVKSVKTMLDIIIERAFSPHKMFDWIYFFTDDYKKETKALEVLHSYSLDVIERRQEARRSEKGKSQEKKKKAFLDHLLDGAQNDQLTLKEIREEVDSFMFAGHDTTASAISFTLFCVANYPEEQRKILLEQNEIFGTNFERPVTFQDLGDMKYLEMVIKESLRLYPPGPVFGRELSENVSYKGIMLPKGLTLVFFVYGLHRNPNYFPEPEKFLPSRFDGKTPFAYLPFGTGPRNCIGQKFAMAVIKSVVSRIVRTLELLPSVPPHELKLALQTTLTSTNGICVRFKPRRCREEEF